MMNVNGQRERNALSAEILQIKRKIKNFLKNQVRLLPKKLRLKDVQMELEEIKKVTVFQ